MIEFKLDGMTCKHCVARVTQALKEADPHAEVNVDLASHNVAIESSKDPAILAAALTDAGYPPA
ncbi:MAG TPA: heavy-metal-associated domain-containing protein [Rhizobacter sp.]|nr:heavy-metal-associated domain-containing protein [Rhizobacter sp.]